MNNILDFYLPKTLNLASKGNQNTPLILIAKDNNAVDIIHNIYTLSKPQKGGQGGANLSESSEGGHPPTNNNTPPPPLPNKAFRFYDYATAPLEEAYVNPNITAERNKALHALLHAQTTTNTNETAPVVITTMTALCKHIAPPSTFQNATLHLSVGMQIGRIQLLDALELLAYINVEYVTEPGQYSTRGGLVYIYGSGQDAPVRLDFFDNDLERIDFYNPHNTTTIPTKSSTNGTNSTPLKTSTVTSSITILPATDLVIAGSDLARILSGSPEALRSSIGHRVYEFGKIAGFYWLYPFVHNSNEYATFMDYIPKNAHVYIFDAMEHKGILEKMYSNMDEIIAEKGIDTIFAQNYAHRHTIEKYIEDHIKTQFANNVESEWEQLQFHSSLQEFTYDKSNKYKAVDGFYTVLQKYLKENFKIILTIESQMQREFLDKFMHDHNLKLQDIEHLEDAHKNAQKGDVISVYPRKLGVGAVFPTLKLVIVTPEEIFGHNKFHAKVESSPFRTTLADINSGDYVVHVDYGISIYKGIVSREIGGSKGDYLALEYESGDMVYVPLQKIDLVQKYIGTDSPTVSNLRSTAWSKASKGARKAARKIAMDLLKLYVDRKTVPGHAFNNQGEFLKIVENDFPFEETPDQLTALDDVYNDMSNAKPMDRLICGDVGYGKTEIAIRATAKAVESAKQVALIAPTTVLVRQHFIKFKERFKDIPVRVEYLSRLKSPKEVKAVLQQLERGDVDIIIGTHRLLSQDVVFKDLGLLVVDEEQRFGVSHKESITKLKTHIDVLTLSATPIPRTLQLSLSGLRPVSTLNTPPARRQEVGVHIISSNTHVREAIEFELQRNGQVYYLHNNVQSMESIVHKLKTMIPEAVIGMAHGQMPIKQLEDTLLRFYAGEIQILVASTVIENGLDVPNANTMIVNQAHMYGLAQLYQLKGRVGRSYQKGHAYLFIKDITALSEIARKRIHTIQQLSALGSGFKIAMNDLEIRGAGNLLGAEQSGLAVKIGYELFIRMVEGALEEMKGHSTDFATVDIAAVSIPYYIPASYIDDTRVRFEYYRALADADSIEQMNNLLYGMESTFGEFGDEVRNLANIMLIKARGSRLFVTRIVITAKHMKLEFSDKMSYNIVDLMEALDEMDAPFTFVATYEISIMYEHNFETIHNLFNRLQELIDEQREQEQREQDTNVNKSVD